MQVSIQIKNINQIRYAFLRAPQKMSIELDKAIRKSTFQIARQSRVNTPVDTGRLRSSHTETFGRMRGIIEPKAEYAEFVHDGTRFMRGRPFLADAVESEESQVQEFFKQAVENVFKRI